MRTPDKEKCRGILEHPRTDSKRGGNGEKCFEPQDEPIPMTCIKMSGAILQGPADGCLVDVGEFGLLTPEQMKRLE